MDTTPNPASPRQHRARWTIAALLAPTLLALSLLLLTACDGDVQGYPDRGLMGQATCPAGQHVAPYGDHGIAVCVK